MVLAKIRFVSITSKHHALSLLHPELCTTNSTNMIKTRRKSQIVVLQNPCCYLNRRQSDSDFFSVAIS